MFLRQYGDDATKGQMEEEEEIYMLTTSRNTLFRVSTTADGREDMRKYTANVS